MSKSSCVSSTRSTARSTARSPSCIEENDDIFEEILMEWIWDELIQDNLTLACYGQNSFHPYAIFENMCGLGFESMLVYPQPTSSKLNLGDEIEGNGSKRIASKDSFCRCTRAKVSKEDIQMLADAINERTRMLEREFRRHLPFTMSDCMSKLDSTPQLSTEGMLSMLDVLNSNTDNKVIFMCLTGGRLHAWIEHIHSLNSCYHSYPTWLPINDSGRHLAVCIEFNIKLCL